MRITLKQEFLIENKLPNIAYPVPISHADKIIEAGGETGFADMLFYLQEYSAYLKKSWEELEPAMLRLAEIIAPENDDPVGNIHTPDFYLNVQQRDMSIDVITMIRGDKVLVAIRPGFNFTIGITAFHPFDARTIQCLMEMAQHPQNGSVYMRENNWEYSLDKAAPKFSSMYACDRGESYPSYWKNGLGVCDDGKIDHDLIRYHTRKQIMPNIVAAQIGCYYERMDWD
jgi:hypothetical protein